MLKLKRLKLLRSSVLIFGLCINIHHTAEWHIYGVSRWTKRSADLPGPLWEDVDWTKAWKKKKINENEPGWSMMQITDHSGGCRSVAVALWRRRGIDGDEVTTKSASMAIKIFNASFLRLDAFRLFDWSFFSPFLFLKLIIMYIRFSFCSLCSFSFPLANRAVNASESFGSKPECA